MTDLEIEHISFWLMIKGALIFYFLTIPFKIWAQNRALKKIEGLLDEDEEIIYKPHFDYTAETILPLAVGGFFSGFILPFYFYPQIQNIMLLNRENLFIGFIAFLIILFAEFFVLSWKYIITNKRIITGYSFDFIYKFGKVINLYFKDIKSIKHVRYLSIHNINIITNDDDFFYFGGLKNIEKIKSIIEEQIKKENKL